MATNPTKFSWVDPTTNTDGTPVGNEITSYTIGIRNTATSGSVAGTYPVTVSVTSPTATSEAISAITPALPAGSYAAAIMANSTTANPSTWSTEVTFTMTATVSTPTGFSVA